MPNAETEAGREMARLVNGSGKRVSFSRRFSKRVVVERKIDNVNTVAFGIAVKQIAFAQAQRFSLFAQALELLRVGNAAFVQTWSRLWRGRRGNFFGRGRFFDRVMDELARQGRCRRFGMVPFE